LSLQQIGKYNNTNFLGKNIISPQTTIIWQNQYCGEIPTLNTMTPCSTKDSS